MAARGQCLLFVTARRNSGMSAPYGQFERRADAGSGDGGPGDISVGELPDPTPEPGEIVVAVRACGICGTDIHIADGDLASARYPLVPGHEFAGEVVAVGAAVPTVRGLAPEREGQQFRPGDLVAVDPTLFCGRCRPCRLGHENLCERGARWG